MNAAEIVAALGGRWHGHDGMARCPAHDDGTASLAVREADDRVLIFCHAGCEQAAVIAALKGRGLWAGQTFPAPGKFNPPPAPIATTEDRTAAPRRIWSTTKPIAGTDSETYLRGRGITIDLPPSLRHRVALKHGPTGQLFPAMVAAVQSPDRQITGVHRTFLTQDGTRKAQVSAPKMMLGCCAGGAVRLGPAGPKIAVAEGIETALSIQQATGLATWAALSTSGIRALVLPAQVREVVLCPDGDEPGEQAAQVAAKRFVAEGRAVRIARPPADMDFNDVLLRPENVVSFPSPTEAAHG